MDLFIVAIIGVSILPASDAAKDDMSLLQGSWILTHYYDGETTTFIEGGKARWNFQGHSVFRWACNDNSTFILSDMDFPKRMQVKTIGQDYRKNCEYEVSPTILVIRVLDLQRPRGPTGAGQYISILTFKRVSK